MLCHSSRIQLRAFALLGLAAAAIGGCDRDVASPTDGSTNARQGALASAAELAGEPLPPIAVELLPPIAVELLTGRHEFTDDVAAQIRLKPEGRSRKVVNLRDPSNMVVAKITVQPGARFPWHTHPGPVLVAVTQGDLVYVYADDCVERTYPATTAFVDPGANVHYAFNPTEGETVLIAIFFGVPAQGPLTIPVDAATATALDAKCGVAAASSHTH